MKISTSERRKSYTPEQLAAEAAYRKRRYAENRDRILADVKERQAAYRLANGRKRPLSPEAHARELAHKRARYQERRDEMLAYASKYRADNYDRLKSEWTGAYRRRKDYFDRYRRENYDKIRARRLAWSAANSERIKQLNAEWSRNNLDKHRLHQHRRRARIKGGGGSLSPNIIETLLVKQKGRCACCGERLRGSYDLDHIVPLAKGGPNIDENVQLLTPRCNRQKGAEHPIEFMQRRRGKLL